jgi:hypothetical protein
METLISVEEANLGSEPCISQTWIKHTILPVLLIIGMGCEREVCRKRELGGGGGAVQAPRVELVSPFHCQTSSNLAIFIFIFLDHIFLLKMNFLRTSS